MSDPETPLTYVEIVDLGKRLGRPASSLIVLAPANDPFYLQPARQAAAQWFKTAVWDLLQPEQGVHLRRLHYAIASTRPPKPDGLPYENSEDDWKFLSAASVAAREAGLVDPGMFVDRRAGEPVYVHEHGDEASDADIWVDRSEPTRAEATLPSLSYTPQLYSFPSWPHYIVEPPTIVEPYAIELWAEKSTMNDVLGPIARQHGVSFIAGVGELSLTHCHRLIDRVREHRRATRILYISDFDPAGDGMPVSIARKIEFLLRRDGLDLDIRLDPLVLTAAQVGRYRLPRIPIKASDRRKDQFEDRHGEGAVELDALEALHPGELRRIVLQAVRTYRETARQQRREIEDIAEGLERDADEIRESVLVSYSTEIAELRSAYEAMLATIRPHEEALATLIAEFEARLETEMREHVKAINAATAPFYERAAELHATIDSELEAEAPDAAEADWPEPSAAEESDDPLFQSERGYLDQIARYKRHQGKPTSRRPRNGGSS